ncbi:MAG: protein phosphatase 2C domain-containing protein [Cyanobacteria bacterium J06632_3]
MNGEESKYPFKQYVWALGHGTNKIPIGDRVDNRYQVVAPSIWLDTKPNEPPKVPEQVPSFALPYLKAYPYQLNLPGVYGICHQESGEAVLLLSNVPVSPKGKLMPAIAKAWPTAPAFRQIYWLWQMMDLWKSLQSFGATASLLKKSNIRVEAWRVRLIGLSTKPAEPTLTDLADVWEQLYLPGAKPTTKQLLTEVCRDLRSPNPDLSGIIKKINDQLLIEAAGKTVAFQVAGGTSAGPRQSRNEDACYPSKTELKRAGTADLPLLPRLAIVCDGVGGHDGGEVASQRVVRSLQLQLRGLLAEAMEQSKAIPPHIVVEQIEAAIRVANNLIAQQNDEQQRADRQRMGTTLAMALILPQRINTPNGPAEVNELYLTHVGDSRAYWITPEHCQQLTVDDNIAGREVSAGKSFYATANQRPDAQALSQAVGVREYEHLHPHTQRFLFESSGVLMLCSDGLSDNQQVENSWANYIGLIMKQIVSLDAAVEAWIELANQKNGHDNATVVLMHAMMSDPAEQAELNNRATQVQRAHAGAADLASVGAPATVGTTSALIRSGGGVQTLTRPEVSSTEHSVEMTAASRALLYGEDDDDDAPLTPEELEAVQTEADVTGTQSQGWVTALMAIIVIGVIGLVGWLLWRNFESSSLDNREAAPEEQTEFLNEDRINQSQE